LDNGSGKKTAMTETSFNLAELENRIQKLISLHKELKAKAEMLQSENQRLKAELREEREKALMMQEGFRKMKNEEKSVAGENIGQLKKKINDIISEIDKSVTLINEQSK
jgi:DNA repair exonuclease SbcCD ATPase subunit